LTARIFLKLIVGTLCVLLVALAAADILASRVAEHSHLNTLERELALRGQTLCPVIEGRRDEVALAVRNANARLTWVSAGGAVVFDTLADAGKMENHRDRPEVASALRGATGSARRRSGTLGTDYLYVAVPCKDGALRLAVPLEGVAEQVYSIRGRMLGSIVLAFVPAFVVAAFFARSVSSKLGAIIDYSAKLAEGRFQARLEDLGKDELGHLAQRLNETAQNLERIFAELQREHSELEKQEQVRKDFVINLSHELRTPLASILGYSETLLAGAINDPRHNLRFLQIIRQNTERLTNLASDLLTLTRIENKAEKFQFASYYVNALLLDCVDSMRPIASKKEVHLRIEAAPDHCEIFADSRAVHQILGNLLDNAIKYSPPGAEVVVGAKPAAKGAPFVQFTVKDFGPGIPESEQSRLFERFYRADKARSRDLGGTGLGLAIVKHLVKTHGGDVGVESCPGSGSRFWFTLPVSSQFTEREGALQSDFIESEHDRHSSHAMFEKAGL
jgi:two-component system phosphate regulon sensor histidine kinase PhoR